MNKEDLRFLKRSDKVAYMKTGDNEYHRMKGFTALTKNFNPQEYARQYVDETFETTDVVGISVSLDFEFDQRKNDPVHNILVDIIENEKLGDDATVTILSVDFSEEDGVGFKAVERDFSVIPESGGDGTEFYKYGGSFMVKGDRILGTATSENDFKTSCKFVEKEDGILGGE